MVMFKYIPPTQSHQRLQFSLKYRNRKSSTFAVAANAIFANHKQNYAKVYTVLYIIIGSSRECENIVAYPIHVRRENYNDSHLQLIINAPIFSLHIEHT